MAQIKRTFMTKQLKLHGEIRKVEEYNDSFKSKDGRTIEIYAILLKVDDDEENRIEIYDKCSENLTKYQRGMTGTFTLRVDLEENFGIGKYECQMLVIDFIADE